MISHEIMWSKINEAIEVGDFEPSEWEETFLSDISEKLNNLTPQQSEKLQEIYDKVMA